MPPVSPVTATGDDRWIIVPSPSWPCRLSPHAHTVPSDLIAREWLKLEWIARTLPSPPTCTGVWRSVVVPSPTEPRSFRPQAHTVPFDLSARLCQPPAE